MACNEIGPSVGATHNTISVVFLLLRQIIGCIQRLVQQHSRVIIFYFRRWVVFSRTLYMCNINSVGLGHWGLRFRRLSAAMENASLSSDVWNNVTTSSQSSDPTSNLTTSHLANIRDLVFKVIYIIIGTVGVLDNLFVLIVFIFFIKITEKVRQNYAPGLPLKHRKAHSSNFHQFKCRSSLVVQ